MINTDHLTKGKTMENKTCDYDADLADLRRRLCGTMMLHAETHTGEHITVKDVRPNSVVWKAMHVEQPNGQWTTMLVLSMEHENSDRITYVPNVRIWFTE